MDLTDWLDNQPPPYPCVKGKEKFSISVAISSIFQKHPNEYLNITKTDINVSHL